MSLRNALAYLTALRIPPRTRVPLPHSLHYFPWVGAAIGSLNILAFLAVSKILPAPLACGVAVLLPQALTGFSSWRGAIEALRGVRTLPGHGFAPGFRLDARGAGLAAALFLVKWAALLTLSADWRVRAVFLFPILGMCARTAIFLSEAPSHRPRGPFAARRRVRAGFLSGLLSFLVFLFPVRAALFILFAGAGAVWSAWRAGQRGNEGRAGGLTLQTPAVASEAAEIAVLAGLVVSGLLLFRF